ncbi:hypothetical protein BH18ACT12_BH18ACT12_13060 [soil metagenome]
MQRTATHDSIRRGLVLAGMLAGTVAIALFVPTGGSARPQAPPQNTGEPRISGTPVEGRVLTAGNGSWSGTSPFRYSYRWLRCDTSGGGVNGVTCTGISGAVRRTYAIRRADVSHRIRVRVTAANPEGSSTATSNATEVIRSAATTGAPRNVTPPTITGSPQVGQTLTADYGTWAGANPQTFSYHWRRCDLTGGSCSDISGATGRTYVLTTADEGTTIRVRVAARNSRGASSATSVPSGVIANADLPSGATISINDVALPNRLLIDNLRFTPQPLRSRQPFTARFHVADSRNHSVQGALVFVVAIPFGSTTTPAEGVTGADGWVTFTMQPTVRVDFGRPGGIVMFVRARKATDRLIGGVSTRRLVQLSIR